jgi:hypothetical protein
MSKFDSIFKKVGADKYVFIPSTSPNPLPMDQWPTLGDMIAANQRLVVFIGEHINAWSNPIRLITLFRLWCEPGYSAISPGRIQPLLGGSF